MTKNVFELFGGQFVILGALYTLVLAVVMLDLWSGVRKARRRGEFRSSYGLRKTVTKLAGYFNMMLVLTVIDAMLAIAALNLNPQLSVRIPVFPILTLLGALFSGFIELRSIYEKADDKSKKMMSDTAGAAGGLLPDATVRQIMSRLAEILKPAENDGDETQD